MSKGIEIVDAPIISLEDGEYAGDAILKFYAALGWNGSSCLNPRKIKTTTAVYENLLSIMIDGYHTAAEIGMLMVNNGPSVEDEIPFGKVYLLEGWNVETES